MQPTLFSWLPFAMIGIGFIFILICALGLYLIFGRTSASRSDTAQYGIPYVPQDIPGRPAQQMPNIPQQMLGQMIDPRTGLPYIPPGGINPSPTNAVLPTPTMPAPRTVGQVQQLMPEFCKQCGFPFQAEIQQFCPRCGARRGG